MDGTTKFKVWDKEDKCWLDNSNLYISANGASATLVLTVDGLDDIGYYSADEVEVVRYTGLKDKNGVEIFEGDILATFSPGQPEDIGVVEFQDGSFWRTHEVRGNNELPYMYIRPAQCEVRGDTYENPELVESAA